jgi:hypothetical protein
LYRAVVRGLHDNHRIAVAGAGDNAGCLAFEVVVSYLSHPLVGQAVVPLLSVLLAVRQLPIRRLAVGLLPIRLLPVAWCCHNRAVTPRSGCEAAFQNTVIVPDIPDATLKPGE